MAVKIFKYSRIETLSDFYLILNSKVFLSNSSFTLCNTYQPKKVLVTFVAKHPKENFFKEIAHVLPNLRGQLLRNGPSSCIRLPLQQKVKKKNSTKIVTVLLISWNKVLNDPKHGRQNPGCNYIEIYELE